MNIIRRKEHTSELSIKVFEGSLSRKTKQNKQKNACYYFKSKFYKTSIWKVSKRSFIVISFTYQGVAINLRANGSLSGKYLNGISVIWLYGIETGGTCHRQ